MKTLTGDKPTILIVDDTPTNIQILADALRTDCRVLVASSGGIALEIIARKGPPDLVLLDVMMPDMDGYAVCRRIKEETLTQQVPVIFVTAKTDPHDEEYGLRLGAVDYITKPFRLPIVLARVRNHLNLKFKNDLLEALAQIDALTNIPNRRRFDESLTAEWKRAQRANLPLALAVADIDHFKLFNDHYGHGAGDVCLGRVAAALAGTVSRPGDLVARYGGEEFVALLPGVDSEGALQIARRLCDQVEALRIPHGHSPTSEWVTVSVGVASTIPQADEPPTTLFEKADRRLYDVKQSGRNGARGWLLPG